MQKCPISLRNSEAGLLLPTHRILGPRLKKIDNLFSVDRLENAAEESAAAWSLCPNLKALLANEVTLEGIRAITATPKHDLKELRIYSIRFNSAAEIMGIIEKGTKDVEILHFPYIQDNIPLRAFNNFIRKNLRCARSSLPTSWIVLLTSRTYDKFSENYYNVRY